MTGRMESIRGPRAWGAVAFVAVVLLLLALRWRGVVTRVSTHIWRTLGRLCGGVAATAVLRRGARPEACLLHHRPVGGAFPLPLCLLSLTLIIHLYFKIIQVRQIAVVAAGVVCGGWDGVSTTVRALGRRCA